MHESDCILFQFLGRETNIAMGSLFYDKVLKIDVIYDRIVVISQEPCWADNTFER